MTLRLIGDIGGTNARFALGAEDGNGFEQQVTLHCGDYNTPEVAIRHYLETCSVQDPDVICLAVAGPIVNNTVRFTNNHWLVSAASLAASFRVHSDKVPSVQLLNDFEAVAHSIPRLGDDETLQLGPVSKKVLTGDFNVCVIGPGTGLGAAGLIRRGELEIPLVTEAGHVGFAPEGSLQRDILGVLQARYNRVSDERLVSGMGIENLYWALSQIHASESRIASAADVFTLAESGDNIASEAVDLFFLILGQATGNLVLAMGAFDGAYVAGGIAQRHAKLLSKSRFIEGFTNKGRHRQLVERVPTMLVQHPQPGLLGAASVASRL